VNVVAVAIALGSAACYALAAALQHRAARQERRHTTLDPRLLLRLLRRPLWLVGAAADTAGAGLHATALAFGPLALVQPILVSGLLLAIPLEAALDRRRPNRRDLAAVALSAAGLATFVAVAQPRAGELPPSDAALIDVAIVVGVCVAVLLVLARRGSGPRRATLLGVAAGALYALAAALAKACVARLGSDPAGLFADWRLYALVLVGIAGVVINQNAFQAGTLAGPLTGITLTDPLASLAIAVTAFHEELSTGGGRVVIELLAVLVMAWGIRLASKVWSTEDPR
jgi:drug/metabolite transporter (DMT)-like permease